MRALLHHIRGGDTPDCSCVVNRSTIEPFNSEFSDEPLYVDATTCIDDDPITRPSCRARLTEACGTKTPDRIVIDNAGFRREYGAQTTALFTTAGRFATLVEERDARLAERARTDPLAAAEETNGRAGPVASLATETGFDAVHDEFTSYDSLRPRIGPAIADARIVIEPPPDGRLRDTRELSTGAIVREYESPDAGPMYNIVPQAYEFGSSECAMLADARRLLADGTIPDGDNAPERAVSEIAGEHRPTIANALRKHTRGFGVLEDVFSDPRVTDAFASAPVDDGPLRVTVAGESMRTNVRFTSEGADRLASRLRAESGRPFSRANPTLDTTIEGLGTAGRVRVAGVTTPVSNGTGFALRAHNANPFTLADLVGNGTVTPEGAGFLAETVTRGAAMLFAGARGAGKTTALGAMLWSLPNQVRLVTIEDTPELPTRALRADGRDVQALYANSDDTGADVSMADALKTALRLGDGALAVGEVRGEEASVLYEAMRVGASDDAVLGTIHGDNVASVRERVVSDLGVPESSFSATDIVVTLTNTGRGRCVTEIAEIIEDGASVLFADNGRGVEPTGRLTRGNSTAIGSLVAPGETYADVLAAVENRIQEFRSVQR